MTDPQIASLLLLALLGLLALRVPIGAALIAVPFVGIWLLFGWRPAIGALKGIPYNFAASWQLSSVPMFLFLGFLAYNAGLTKGLFRAAQVWLARLPGGLAVASIFGAAGFASITGSSVACAAAMGRIAIPEMLRNGYSHGLATGSVAAAGTVGALIPPSILLIVFGIVAQVPIGDLFLGGLVAGVLSILAYVVVALVWAIVLPSAAPRVTEAFTLKEKLATLRDVAPLLILVVLIFGGMFTGVFTPTEAGAVGSALCIVIAALYRSLSWSAFRASVVETFVTTAAIFIIAIGANLLGRFVTLSGMDGYLSSLILSVATNEFLLLGAIVLIYLLLGMFLDPMGAMLLTMPILLPVAFQAELSFLWFGVFVVKLLEIGLITPPIGLNVFVIKNVIGASIPLETIFKGVTAFLVADLLVVALLVIFPEMITALPSLLR